MGNKQSTDGQVSYEAPSRGSVSVPHAVHLFSRDDFPVRILLMQECRTKTHPLLYDSVNPSKSVDLFSELMFGALPFKMRTDHTKVHTIPSMDSLLISKVFPVTANSSTLDSNAGGSSTSGHHSNGMHSDHSRGMHVSASTSAMKHVPSFEEESGDGEIRAHVMRRVMSFDGGSMVMIDEDRLQTTNSIAAFRDFAPHEESHAPMFACRVQCGLGIVFPLVCFDVCQRVFVVLEYRIRKLMRTCRKIIASQLSKVIQRELATNAGSGKPQLPSALTVTFVNQAFATHPVLLAAVQDFRQSMFAFLSASLIPHPLWTHSLQGPQSQNESAALFMRAYEYLSKQTKSQFVAVITSCVLAHHLSWIDTVSTQIDGSSAPVAASLPSASTTPSLLLPPFSQQNAGTPSSPAPAISSGRSSSPSPVPSPVAPLNTQRSSSNMSQQSSGDADGVRFPLAHHRLSLLGGSPFLRWLVQQVRCQSHLSRGEDLDSPSLRLCRIILIEDDYGEHRNDARLDASGLPNADDPNLFVSTGRALSMFLTYLLRGPELEQEKLEFPLPWTLEMSASQQQNGTDSLPSSPSTAFPASLPMSAVYFADWSDRYCGDFVLQRIPRSQFSLNTVVSDMRLLAEQPFLEMDVDPSNVHTVIVDVPKQVCEVVCLSDQLSTDASQQRTHSMDHLSYGEASHEMLTGVKRLRFKPAPLVCSMLDEASALSAMGVGHDVAVDAMHAAMQTMVVKARALKCVDRKEKETEEALAPILGVDRDDVPLLRNIASAL